jgi:hypothetical protein
MKKKETFLRPGFMFMNLFKSNQHRIFRKEEEKMKAEMKMKIGSLEENQQL